MGPIRVLAIISTLFVAVACHAEPVAEATGQHAHSHHDHKASAGSHVKLTDAQWKERLSSEQYRILREKGTERAGTGVLLREKRPGTYRCAACGAALFDAKTKFESGTGWPSFFSALPGRVSKEKDDSLFVPRVEILCSRCGGHLGHVFGDGPAPTGQRYCVNSVSLEFDEAKKSTPGK